MATYKVGWKASTRQFEIKRNSESLTGGFASRGTFDWTPSDNNDGYDANKTFFHFIQDKAYALGILDTSSYTIIADVIVNAVSIDVTPATKTLDISNAETQQLVVAFTPSDTDDKRVTYVSSDPTKATVSKTGLITPLVAGSTTITVTSRDGAKVDTCVVTVQA